MIIMNDDWTEIIKLAQALMPERPTTALNRFICDKSERGGHRAGPRMEGGTSGN